MFFPAGLGTHHREKGFNVQGFEKVKMFLQILFIQQQIFQVFFIPVKEGIFILCPGKKRRIICNMDTELDAFRLFRMRKPWQSHPVVQHLIKVLQRLHARKNILAVLAEKSHKTSVPDPDVIRQCPFIHIGRKRQARQLFDMVVGQFPRFVVKRNKVFTAIANGTGDKVFPLFPRRKIFCFFHHKSLLPYLRSQRFSGYKVCR